MKKTKTFALLFILLFSLAILEISCTTEENNSDGFLFTPKQPSPGETIRVTYSPRENVFQTAEKIQMLAYNYTAGFPKVMAVDMEKQGQSWVGSFASDKDCYGAAVKFKAGEEIDNNQKTGYFIPFYADDGTLIAGARAGQGEAIASWGDLLMDTERDAAKALSLFDEEFLSHPEMKKTFLYAYIRALIEVKPEGWEETALAAADSAASEADLDEDTMNTLVNCYRQLKKKDKMEDMVNRAKEKFPQGYQAQSSRFQEFNQVKDLKEKTNLFEKFKTNFPESNMINTMAYYMVRGYLSSGEIDELKMFIKENPDIKESYVYSMAASQLLEKKKELDFAA